MPMLAQLRATNFRNLSADWVQFGAGINCIMGDNGHGKTNLLEAIHVLINGKSFRKQAAFSKLLSVDCESCEIFLNGHFLMPEKNGQSTLALKMEHEKKNVWYKDNCLSKRRPDISSVFINPFDAHHFFSTPAFRRAWIDNYLSQIDVTYRKILGRYLVALRFRNALFTSSGKQHISRQIDAVDPLIAQYTVYLTKARLVFVQELQRFVGPMFKSLFSEDHDLQIILDSKFIGATEKEILDFLLKNRPKDLEARHTTQGAHRDDYALLFDGFNAFDFCSLGQQKASYLSLLFAYIEVFRYKYLSYPIVLVDDISGELDKVRWQRLVTYLQEKDFQVFITTANDGFRKELERIEGAHQIWVCSGKIGPWPVHPRSNDNAAEHGFSHQGQH
jgi:DNA replication and repair protein RecF